jgi:hypothetical protein
MAGQIESRAEADDAAADDGDLHGLVLLRAAAGAARRSSAAAADARFRWDDLATIPRSLYGMVNIV